MYVLSCVVGGGGGGGGGVFFNDTATTEIYTLSLHDALPIWPIVVYRWSPLGATVAASCWPSDLPSNRFKLKTSKY